MCFQGGVHWVMGGHKIFTRSIGGSRNIAVKICPIFEDPLAVIHLWTAPHSKALKTLNTYLEYHENQE